MALLPSLITLDQSHAKQSQKYSKFEKSYSKRIILINYKISDFNSPKDKRLFKTLSKNVTKNLLKKFLALLPNLNSISKS